MLINPVAVAAEAGVSTGLIYRHFPSKADLFVEVLTAAVEHELDILSAIADGPQSLIREQVEMGVAVRMAVLEALARNLPNGGA